jgi:hypothetical protein
MDHEPIPENGDREAVEKAYRSIRRVLEKLTDPQRERVLGMFDLLLNRKRS